MHRRSFLFHSALLPVAWPAPAAALTSPSSLDFPVDFGAHPASRTEWWYLTGSLAAEARLFGFQVTFFRSTTGSSAPSASHFDASQLVFAHAAITDIDGRRLRHDQRIARSGFHIAEARTGDTFVTLRDWSLARTADPPGSARSRYTTTVASDSAGFRLDLRIQATQTVLLQGVDGLSKKGPEDAQTSRYYSEPQLDVQGALAIDGKRFDVAGRAWLDHEWSDSFMARDAVGWDWIGMNLDDGSALTAFRLRRADGASLHAGGSFRPRSGAARNFDSAGVQFVPVRTWDSATSRARYPVEWKVATPSGRYAVRALLDNQELDSRNSTGAIYWEGLSELLDESGRPIGRGYLEMTGYADPLRL